MWTTETREIPREEWVSFFNAFSRRHEHWLVSVQILNAEIGAQFEVSSLGFEGMNADLKDGEDLITISLGSMPSSHLTHAVEHPKRIWQSQREVEGGYCEVLEIESEGGSKTLVRFDET